MHTIFPNRFSALIKCILCFYAVPGLEGSILFICLFLLSFFVSSLPVECLPFSCLSYMLDIGDERLPRKEHIDKILKLLCA